MKKEFTEQQKFTQWLLWLIILIHTSVIAWQMISTESLSLILVFVGDILIAALFFILKLKTKINKQSIKMVFFPFNKKEINWKEVKSLKVLDYNFVGGWGVRIWTKYGTVYNIKGSKGLLVELNNGKTFVIGTQKEEELRMFLKDLGKLSE